MSKIYNIMDRLDNVKPSIQLAEDKIFKVNNSKNTAIAIKAVSEDKKLDDFKRMDKIVELALGKKALEYIDSLELSVKSYGTVITAIMAAISEEELEELEELAENEAEKIKKKQ